MTMSIHLSVNQAVRQSVSQSSVGQLVSQSPVNSQLLFVSVALPVSVWPWHGDIVPLVLHPAIQHLQRRCLHNPGSLNRTRLCVLTEAGDYVDSGTMANRLNTGHVSPLFLSETKCRSYYISSSLWERDSVDNRARQASHDTNIDNILSQSVLSAGCFHHDPAFQFN